MVKTRSCELDEGQPAGRKGVCMALPAVLLLFVVAGNVHAQQAAPTPKPSMEIYGFAMMDMGHDFNTIDPNWFDTMRPTRLPSFPGEFGPNNNTYAAVRQTRFGVKTSTQTSLGELKTTFEFDMFGVGFDAGQTTIRLRHAYGEVGQFGAGQTHSPFMDINVFPNSIEYWGPSGMVFYRNVQFRWMPLRGDTSLTLALERPGASGDPGNGLSAQLIELENVKGRFPLPDFTGEFIWGGHKWGYLRFAGALRRIQWDDLLLDQFDISGHATGWGVNVSSNVNFGAKRKSVLKMEAVYGSGIENYMNDATADIGAKLNPGNTVSPVVGQKLPVLGATAFLDHSWSEKWTSSFGYSLIHIDNASGQSPRAFKTGQYALANIIYSPVPNVYVGGEYEWGHRDNDSDGFKQNGNKFQVSFKYNFSYKLGG